MSVGSLHSVSGSGPMVNVEKKRVLASEAEDVSSNNGEPTAQVVDIPNRNDFERNLWKLNNATNSVQTQASWDFSEFLVL
jgi:hypothetical protein